MRSPDTVDAVNCENCGAGLDLLGGGRVASAFCGSCGSELDPNDNFRVVRTLTEQTRPRTPFSIGMKGRIHGVEWTIIGTIGKGEYANGESWLWAEHQLYSPTHGYAWLTFETGLTTFSSRVRKRRSFPMYSEAEMETMENAPTVRRFGQRFSYYESGVAFIESLEGEFSWKPSIGDARYYHLYAPTFGLGQLLFEGQPEGTSIVGYEVSRPLLDSGEIKGEKELDEVSYLNQSDIEREFGLRSGTLRRNAPHPIRPWPRFQALNFAAIVAFVSFWLMLFAMVGGNAGVPVLERGSVRLDSLPQEIPFDVSAVGRGVKVSVQMDLQNAWGYVETGVYDPEDIPLFEVGREIGFYEGVEGGESWSEGNKQTEIRFRAETAGVHTLELNVPEQGTWTGGGMVQSPQIISYEIKQDLSAVKWLGYTALLFLFFALVSPFSRLWSDWQNWMGSDW